MELHGAHGYLINQFFSKYYNRRTDEYGGSLENRMRFISEIIDGIRRELGNYPISVRICGDEMTKVEGYLTLADGLEIGNYLEGKGIDVLNISNGSPLNGNANCDPYSYQPGWKKYVAKAFKEVLNIPIIATNTIKTPEFAESLLQEGVCDFVGLGRSQFADPEFMNKAREGRSAEIRQCIGCMHCRERLLGKGMPVECTVNPRIGQEYKRTELRKNGRGRTVAVIGGGPAGMEAARVLAERRFHVVLFEKEDRLGGAMNIADQPKFKELITNLTETMKVELVKAGAEIRFQAEATVETLKALQPEAVFVAAGADPVIPNLPGISLPKVVLAEDVILGKVKVSGKALIAGTGLTGLETAEFLQERGVTVTLAEMQDTVGPGIYKVVLNDLLQRIEAFQPEVLTGHQLTEVTDTGAKLTRTADGAEVLREADFVILALGVRPRSQIVEAFEAEFDKVIPIGNAAQAGQIFSAIKSGFDKAYVFE